MFRIGKRRMIRVHLVAKTLFYSQTERWAGLPALADIPAPPLQKPRHICGLLQKVACNSVNILQSDRSMKFQIFTSREIRHIGKGQPFFSIAKTKGSYVLYTEDFVYGQPYLFLECPPANCIDYLYIFRVDRFNLPRCTRSNLPQGVQKYGASCNASNVSENLVCDRDFL